MYIPTHADACTDIYMHTCTCAECMINTSYEKLPCDIHHAYTHNIDMIVYNMHIVLYTQTSLKCRYMVCVQLNNNQKTPEFKGALIRHVYYNQITYAHVHLHAQNTHVHTNACMHAHTLVRNTFDQLLTQFTTNYHVTFIMPYLTHVHTHTHTHTHVHTCTCTHVRIHNYYCTYMYTL